MDIKQVVLKKARDASKGARSLLTATSEQKNKVLISIARSLRSNASNIISCNKIDVEIACQKGMQKSFIDRLTLNDKLIEEMAKGLTEIVQLPDPVGNITKMWQRPNGMTVGKMTTPIGVIGIIYESRPNVTIDAAGLCLKAGNAVILRGGSESINSNKILISIMKACLKEVGIYEGAVTFIDIIDRQAIMEILKLEGIVDLIIPRGGEGLIKTVTENSRVPVLKHYKGICHIFVDKWADLKIAEDVCFNAKVQRPGTCNAMETMLVDGVVVKKFLPKMLRKFLDAGVKIKGCNITRSIFSNVQKIKDADFYNEYLDLILNVKVVKGIDEAISHISTYGSRHSDAIITENHTNVMRFLKEVDSSAVLINASTRLNDGYQFGLGAEIGISTDKIHARGPMGLEELTCSKFIVLGNGQIRK